MDFADTIRVNPLKFAVLQYRHGCRIPLVSSSWKNGSQFPVFWFAVSLLLGSGGSGSRDRHQLLWSFAGW